MLMLTEVWNRLKIFQNTISNANSRVSTMEMSLCDLNESFVVVRFQNHIKTKEYSYKIPVQNLTSEEGFSSMMEGILDVEYGLPKYIRQYAYCNPSAYYNKLIERQEIENVT